ncbi:MAG: hypothetical protein JW862_08125 [Anaerolineales bacterium]|nr:hypothetical protein [Anaerolineales bacterium]
MITPQLIEEWIAEIKARPGSAPVILRALGERLRALSQQNEALLTENLELRSGKRADEYEQRIASLEYQLELLKRQVGGQLNLEPLAENHAAETTGLNTLSLLLYTARGQVLRLEVDLDQLESGTLLAHLIDQEQASERNPSLLATRSQEELLLAFDSGRSETLPVNLLPLANSKDLRWDQAGQIECRGLEELVSLLPVATLPLYEHVIQASRRGYVRKLTRGFFETCLAKSYIGTGIRLQADQAAGLLLANPTHRLVLASREGYLWNMAVADLPVTLEEAMRLGRSDHLIALFSLLPQEQLLLVTQTSKVIHRQADWLKPDLEITGRGQASYSSRHREAGVHLMAAAAFAEPEAAWGFALGSSGQLRAHRLADLLSAGALPLAAPQDEILAFHLYQPGRTAI